VPEIKLGWSRERLASESGVSVASVYLVERMQTAGLSDDARIRDALVLALVQKWNTSRFLLCEEVVLPPAYLL
jgi:transcriptional regulator with XRE-family HTH domain